MYKEYGIYRTHITNGNGSPKTLILVEEGFSSHERAETKLLIESNDPNGDIKFKYKGPEYIIIPYYKNNG